MKKIYLIDGMSMVFRAYHAMFKTGLKSPEGMPTGAVFGFTNIITKLLETEKPDHLAVIFDTHEPTFRHIMYPEYKANRDEFPEDLGPQLLKIKEMLDIIGIPRHEMHTYEADDIIGTLAKQASSKNYTAYMLTSDKDFMQLIDDNVKMLRPQSRGEDLLLIDYEQVEDKFGVHPDQVIDVQALVGDSVDNVPGVKGVGEKTAGPLIKKYGTLEELYENLEDITKPALKKKLEENKDNAFLSKKLVTIKIDCPLNFTVDDSELKETDFKSLDKFFADMGFRSLRNKWNDIALRQIGKSIDIKEEITTDNIDKVDKDYQLVDTVDKLNEVVTELEKQKEFSFDLETSSLDVHSCEIVGIALSWKEFTGFYIGVHDDYHKGDQEDMFAEEKHESSLSIKQVIDKVKGVFENPDIGKFGQNSKFDAYILKRYGVNVSPITFDTMLASYILNPDSKHNLDAISEKWLNYSPVSITSLIGEKKKDQRSMKELSPEEINDYACEDADLALRLKNVLEKEIEKEKLQQLAYEIEFPMVEVLTDIEFNGVSIDSEALKELENELNEKIAELTKLIHEEAGTDFNIDSPKQLGHVLFEKLQIPAVKKTKTGYSTDASVMSELASEHKIAEYILDYRQYVKLNSTYIKALPKLVNDRTKRIHTTFNQTVASTGRLSSTNPNLQNIPIRTDLGKQVRRAFIPSSGNILLAADYSQVELRIMAHIADDDTLVKAFEEGIDIHADTASKLFHKKLENVSQDDRRIAKTVNFGIMYGLGAFGLAQRLSLTRSYAKEIIDNYFKSYPGIKKYIDMTVESTREKGYAETLCSRRRYFENINSSNRNLRTQDERAAINLPIQGTASDMMKIAMINIHKEMIAQNYKSKMILQVHDELIFDVLPEELEKLKELVIDKMVNALSLGKVPVVVDTGIGKNWYEAH